MSDQRPEAWPDGPDVTIAAADLRELQWLSERADRAGLGGLCEQHMTGDGYCSVCTAMGNADRILAAVGMQSPIDEDDTPEDVARFLAEREPLERDR